MPCSDQCECQSVPRITLWSGGELLDLLLRERTAEAERGCVYFGSTDSLRIEWSVADDTITVITLDEHGHDLVSTVWRSIAEQYDDDRERWLRTAALLPAVVEAGDTDDDIVITVSDWLLHVGPGVRVDPLDVVDCPNQPSVVDLGSGQYRVTRSTSCTTTVRVGHNWQAWEPSRNSTYFATRWGSPGAAIVVDEDCDQWRRDLFRWVPDTEDSEPEVIADANTDVIWIQLDLQAVSTRPTSRCCATCAPATLQVVFNDAPFFELFGAQDHSQLVQVVRADPTSCVWTGSAEFSRYDEYSAEYAAEISVDGTATKVTVSLTLRYVGAWELVVSRGGRTLHLWRQSTEPNDDQRPELVQLRYAGRFDPVELRNGETLRESEFLAGEGLANRTWWESLDLSDTVAEVRVLLPLDQLSDHLRQTTDTIINQWGTINVRSLTNLVERQLTITASGFASGCDPCGILNGEHTVAGLIKQPVFPGTGAGVLHVSMQKGFNSDDCPTQAAATPDYRLSVMLVESTDAYAVVRVRDGSETVEIEPITDRVRRLELQVLALWSDAEGMRHVFRPVQSDLLSWDWGVDSAITWEYSHSITRVHHNTIGLLDWVPFVWPAFPAQPSPTYPSRSLTSYCDPRAATLVTQLRHATSLTCADCEPYAGEPPLVWSVAWGSHTVAIPRTGGSRWSREIVLDERTLIFRLQRDSDTWRLLVAEIEPVTLDDDDQPIRRRWPVLAEYVFGPEGLGLDRHAGDAWTATDDDPDPPTFPRWHNDGSTNELVRVWHRPDEFALPAAAQLTAIDDTNPRGTTWFDWSAAERDWSEDTVDSACAEGYIAPTPYTRGAITGDRLSVPCVASSGDEGEVVWWSPDGVAWRLIARTCAANLLSLDEPPIAPRRVNDVYRALCFPDDSYIPTGCDYTWNASSGEWEPFPSNACPDGRTCEPPETDGTTDGEERAGDCVIVDCGAGSSEWVCLEPVGLAALSWSLSSSTCPAWCTPTPPDRDPDFVTDFESGGCACTSPDCP